MKRVPTFAHQPPRTESEHRRGAYATWHLGGIWTLLLSVHSLVGQTTNVVTDPNEIPPFRPAKGELPPTFWEQHGLWVLLASVVVLVAAVVVWRLIASRPPPPPPTPAETARAALAALASTHPQLAAGLPAPTLPDQISAILRTHFVAVLRLSVPQLTNRELAAELQSQTKLPRELREQTAAFLVALDRHRFDPSPNAPLPDAVQSALKIVDQTEAALRTTPSDPATPERPTA